MELFRIFIFVLRVKLDLPSDRLLGKLSLLPNTLVSAMYSGCLHGAIGKSALSILPPCLPFLAIGLCIKFGFPVFAPLFYSLW